jgi:hypothetical protein
MEIKVIIGIAFIIAITTGFFYIIKMQTEELAITCDTLHSLDTQLYHKNVSTCDQHILYKIGEYFYQHEPDTIAYNKARQEG